MRGQYNFEQSFLFYHFSISSICLIAATVTRTISDPTSDAGSMAETSHISTEDKLRDARYKFSSTASVIINTLCFTCNLANTSRKFFVLGESKTNDSTTINLSIR